MKILLTTLIFLVFALVSHGEESIEELLQKVSNLQTEKETAVLENMEMKKRQSQLERNIEQLTRKSSYIQELGRMEDKYAHLVADSKSREAQLSDTIARLEAEIRTNKEQLQNKTLNSQPILESGESAVELKARIRHLEDTVFKLQDNADRSVTSTVELESQISELRTTLHKMTNERDLLLLDVRSAGGAVTKAQKEAHIVKDRYKAAMKRLDEQAVTIRELESHHDKCREVAAQQEQTVGALQRRIDSSAWQQFLQKLLRWRDFILRLLRICK